MSYQFQLAANTPRWVFFDAGETLLRLGPLHTRLVGAFAALGYSLPPAQAAATIELAFEEFQVAEHLGPAPEYAVDRVLADRRWSRLVQMLMTGFGIDQPSWERCELAIRRTLADRTLFDLYPDVPSTLAVLRDRGFRLAIVSNWSPDLPALIASHGLTDYFDFVVTSEQFGYAKPGPRIFHHALSLAGIWPGQVVHVGDSLEHDVIGAREVGIRPVLLDRYAIYSPDRWSPIISSLVELPALLGSP